MEGVCFFRDFPLRTGTLSKYVERHGTLSVTLVLIQDKSGRIKRRDAKSSQKNFHLGPGVKAFFSRQGLDSLCIHGSS